MKTIKIIVIAWFVMSAIFQVVAIVFLANRNSLFGLIFSTGILILLFFIFVLVTRSVLAIQEIIESQKSIKP